ncbi:MAG: LLM class flavin-dependent oxidoreductase [Lapillicoccus sp.]
MQLSAVHPWPVIRDLALHAESRGYHGVWVMDHFMDNTPEGGGHVLEGFSVLAALAAVVPRVRLGSLVAGNLYRHPAVLANQASTIDRISEGRFVLGLGAGWPPTGPTAKPGSTRSTASTCPLRGHGCASSRRRARSSEPRATNGW